MKNKKEPNINDGKPVEDVYAWSKDFPMSPEQLAQRGEPIGFMRFVAFQPKNKADTAFAFDTMVNEQFTDALVKSLVENPELLAVFDRAVFMAKGMNAIKDGGLVSFILGKMAEKNAREQSESNPITDLIRNVFGRNIRKAKVEVRVMKVGGPGGMDIESLADFLREVNGGGDCPCPKCTAMREKVAKENEQREKN